MNTGHSSHMSAAGETSAAALYLLHYTLSTTLLVQLTLHTPPSQRPVFWSAVVQVPEKGATSQVSAAVLQRRQGPEQLLELQVTCRQQMQMVGPHQQ